MKSLTYEERRARNAAIEARLKSMGITALDDGSIAGLLLRDYDESMNPEAHGRWNGWHGGPEVDLSTIDLDSIGKYLIQAAFDIGRKQGAQEVRNALNNILNPR